MGDLVTLLLDLVFQDLKFELVAFKIKESSDKNILNFDENQL